MIQKKRPPSNKSKRAGRKKRNGTRHARKKPAARVDRQKKKDDAKTRELKNKLLVLNIAGIEKKELEPIVIQYSFDTVQDILDFNKQISDIALNRQINERFLGALNGVVRNALTARIPRPGVTVNVQTAAGPITKEQEDQYLRIIETMSPEEKMLYVKVQRKLEDISPASGV